VPSSALHLRVDTYSFKVLEYVFMERSIKIKIIIYNYIIGPMKSGNYEVSIPCS